jgi:hypothetical protein
MNETTENKKSARITFLPAKAQIEDLKMVVFWMKKTAICILVTMRT